MDPKISTYIAEQPADRQRTLSDIHRVILDNDNTVTAEIEPMMGKEMILYKSRGMMKYGLAGVKNHMSLHVLPIYVSKSLFDKFEVLLPAAKFQKGCINFTTAENVPLEIVRQLVVDCAGMDLVAIREEHLKKKPKAWTMVTLNTEKLWPATVWQAEAPQDILQDVFVVLWENRAK